MKLLSHLITMQYRGKSTIYGIGYIRLSHSHCSELIKLLFIVPNIKQPPFYVCLFRIFIENCKCWCFKNRYDKSCIIFFCEASSQNSILSNHFAKQRSYAKSKYAFTLKAASYSLFNRSKDPNPFRWFEPIENII